MTRINRSLLALLKWLLIIELGYLLLINLALQLPLTQTLVNKIKPEKFHVSWESAWSWYPFRVHAQGIVASGQSRSQQWQVGVTSASGSINLLPLVLKRVIIRDVSATDIDYRQRPRLKPDKDYTALLPHFPDIEGWEVAPADTSPRKKKRPWKLSIDNASASGTHKIWIFNINGGGSGELQLDLAFETRGGPFSMDATDLELKLDPAYLNGNVQVFNRGTVQGNVGFAPFVPRENKGVRMLPFLKLDTHLDLDVESLKFINLFTANLGEFFIDGAGEVSGRFNFDQGYLLAGTDLSVAARDLAIQFRDMNVAGEGAVRIHTPEDADIPAVLDVNYNSLQITREGDDRHFLEGDGLAIRYSGHNFVAPEPGLNFESLLNDKAYRERRKDNTVKVAIKEASVVDMTMANDYLPETTPLSITGGTASLTADLFAEVEDMSGGLQLTSTDLELEADGQALQGNLALDVVVAGGVPRELRMDLSGTKLVLDELSVVGNEESFDGDYWSAAIDFDRLEGVVRRPVQLESDLRMRISDTRPLVAVFQNQKSPPKWISGLLSMKDIDGEASVSVEQDLVVIPHASILSDKAEVAAKVAFTPDARTGRIYARYKKLDVLLKLMGQEKDMDVIKVREKFDDYELKY
jgi:hypothetical protein